jgi:D-alanyl-D-alanine carboxypeptidase (penicillin-binding protein 5/6)
VVLLLLGSGWRPLAAAPRPALLRAEAAVVVDARTGRVLFARQIHRRLPPASTTKIVTALVVLERLGADASVTIGPEAAALRTGAHVSLVAGERWTAGALVRALLLRSANDAAVALADAVAGDQARFAALMTARAHALGARDTRFVNPHGLHDARHYSTAYDLAQVARYALRNPTFAAIVRVPSWTLVRPGGQTEELENRNRLIGAYAGADGVKTGHTAAAGYTLVGSATRDGWQLVAVVLRSEDMYGDVRQLLDYGFATFAPVRLAARGQPLAPVTVGGRRTGLVAVPPADVHAVVRRGAAVSPRVRLHPDLREPIAVGVRVGTVEFLEGTTEVVARSILVAAGRPAR